MAPSSKDELRARLLAIFREEAADHLRAIGADVVLLEREGQQPDELRAVLDRLFRTAHTLKGAARSLSIRTVEQLCHEMEDICSAGRNSNAFGAEERAALRDLARLLAEASEEAMAASAPQQPVPRQPAAPQPAPPPPPVQTQPSPPPRTPSVPLPAAPEPEVARPAPAASAATREQHPASPPPLRREAARENPPAAPLAVAPSFVRLEAAHLQRLGLKAEELTGPRLAAQARVDQARDVVARLGTLRAEHRLNDGSPAARGLREAEQAARRLLSSLSDDSRVLNATGESLAEELRQTRMMRVGEMLAVFPAMVADIAAEVEKDVSWHSAGTDLLIDREIADMIKDPLIQMVRNAIDHGIEPQAERLRAGKPARGTISLTIEPAEGGRVAIELHDDGGGIDVPALREAAIRHRIAQREQVAGLSDEMVIEMAFEPSVSTRSVINAFSGRGLGLAIVRERMERLSGAVNISSSRGIGTTIHLEVPAALANFHGVGVRCGDHLVIWPRTAVERTLALSDEACEAALARGILPIDDKMFPVAELSQILGYGTLAPVQREHSLRAALLVRHREQRGVVLVEEVTGNCEVIVKEFRPPLLRVRHALAAGLLGNGQLGLIVRPADILEGLLAGAHRVTPRPHRRVRQRAPKLLVADDSITTRAMEVGLLEAAGYEVVAASDGFEAWSALQAGDFDAIISDVDMPNMDGFELTQKVRSDPKFGKLPIVLVTALEDREDHERGLRLGANAYMMKSAFDQSMLIDLVRRVL